MREVQTNFRRSKVVRERYVVDELLGQGGFGAVYLVHDRRVKNNVFALKEIVDPNNRQRVSFTFEGELLRRLDHPHLPRVYRTFEDEKYHRLYMLMDYIDGPNLEHLRVQQPERRFSFSQTLRIMAPVIEAVIYLHAQTPPIIHRDIKPANIIVLTSGEGAFLVDFGIAKEYDLNATTTAVRHCSPGYGAPEQYIRDTNPRTDVYGLGATFYTLLTGEVPIDSLYRITSLSGRGTDPLVPIRKLVAAIPVPVADILQRALALNSDERFTSVEEFWGLLKAYDIEKVTDLLPLEAPAVVPSVKQTVNLQQSRRGTYSRRKYGQAFLVGLVSLMMVALSAGVIFGAGQHFNIKHTKSTVSNHNNRTSQSPIPFSTRDTARNHHSIGHAPPGVPDSPASGMQIYPDLVLNYDGTIHNLVADVHSTMSLTQLHQAGSSIYGYFIVGPGLIGNGHFTGSITGDHKVQFLVLADAHILPLFFKGEFHPDGSISGSYCSYQHHHCNYSGGGYGQWHVIPHTI
jgi:eukaryotic-like serine/threonine-protein kinase